MSPVTLVYMGTAELACPALHALAQNPAYQVAAVVTQPDKPQGRHLQLHPSPVKTTAQTLHLPILQPEKARHPEFLEQIRQIQPDLIVVAAYGQLLPQNLLDIPPSGCINIHASLLPKYRGAAPIQWALLNRETHTGITIMRLDAGLDTGDILSQQTIPISDQDDAPRLHDRLAQLGAQLLLETIPPYLDGHLQPQPQPPSGSSYARKITKADGCLNWTQPASHLWHQIRALIPWPGAYTLWPTNTQPKILKIWKAQVIPTPPLPSPPGTVYPPSPHELAVVCGQDSLQLLELQLEGGKRLTPQAFRAGHPFPPNLRLA